MFGGRKTKAGSGGGLTVRVCLCRREEGSGPNLLVFPNFKVQAALGGAGPGRSPRSAWRWPPGEEKAGIRASLVRRKRLTRRFGQQNRPNLGETRSDLALRVGHGGEGEGCAAPLGPSSAG